MHAQPDNAVVENDALVDVYDAMVSDWGTEVSPTASCYVHMYI